MLSEYIGDGSMVSFCLHPHIWVSFNNNCGLSNMCVMLFMLTDAQLQLQVPHQQTALYCKHLSSLMLRLTHVSCLITLIVFLNTLVNTLQVSCWHTGSRAVWYEDGMLWKNWLIVRGGVYPSFEFFDVFCNLLEANSSLCTFKAFL